MKKDEIRKAPGYTDEHGARPGRNGAFIEDVRFIKIGGPGLSDKAYALPRNPLGRLGPYGLGCRPVCLCGKPGNGGT